ncbi:7634_t:CDS:2, partial [Dentiscutata heterogama]
IENLIKSNSLHGFGQLVKIKSKKHVDELLQDHSYIFTCTNSLTTFA